MALPQTIDRLIEIYGEKAYTTAYNLAGNEPDARDLVQETFLRIIHKAELCDPAFDFGGWLHRILFRVYLNRRRSEARRREIPLELVSDDRPVNTFEHMADPAESPENIMERSELRDRIFKALDGLEPAMRACVVLVDIERRNYEEAAAILNWPVGSVAGRLFRARRLLRGTLGRIEGDDI